MKIGIAGPISTESVKELIAGDSSDLPRGYSGAPFLGTLIKAYIKRGHQVSAYTLDNSIPPDQNRPLVAEGPNFKIYYCPLRKRSIRPNGRYLGRIVDFYYREIRALKTAIVLDDPDVVHGHWSYEFALAAMAADKPYLVTCHDSPLKVLKYMTNYYRFARLLMAMYVFKRSKNLSAVSPYVKNEISRFTNADILVMPNPTPIAEIRDLFEDVDLDLSAPKIVMILNGWGPLKNAKPALQAFNGLLRQYPRATLHIFGQDFQPNGPAHQWALQQGVEAGVTFHGPTVHADILDFLKHATFLLHPSLEECCPMTLIESMSFGLPVIGGQKSGGVPWVLEFGASGVLADVKNPADILEKITKLIESKSDYLELRKQAIKRIKDLFSQEVVASGYESIYQELMEGK